MYTCEINKEIYSIDESLEFFSLIRNQTTTSCDTRIYFNERFIENFKEIIETDPRTKLIHKEVVEKINKKDIIAGYTTSNIISHLIKKASDFITSTLSIFTYTTQKKIMGIFCPIDRKIIIVLDENTNILGSAEKKGVIDVLLHELSHYYCNINPQIFHRICEKRINNYFLKLLKKIKKEINWEKYIPNIKILTKNLIFNEREKRLKKQISMAINFWYEFLNEPLNNNKKEIEDLLDKIFFLFMTILGIDTNEKEISKKINLLIYFKEAYLENGIILRTENFYKTFHGQEVIYPSEIIAVSNSLGVPNELEKLMKLIK